MLPIRIIDSECNLKTEIKQYQSLLFTRSWHGVGQLTLIINRYTPGTEHLQKGHILFPHNQLHKAYMIRHREIQLDAAGKASENWKVIAYELKSIVGRRLTYVPLNEELDSVEGDAESVMRHYIKNNVIASVDEKRIIPQVVLAENKQLGQQMKWESRFKPLDEELEAMSKQSQIGWSMRVDLANKKFVAEFQAGRILTADQRARPPVIFSPQFKTLRTLSYLESDVDYRNAIIIEGPPDEERNDKGEVIQSEERRIELGDTDGLNRFEIFQEAKVETQLFDEEGNASERPEEEILADMQQEGLNTLQQHEQEVYLEGEALAKSQLVYEVDWDLGDVVTIQHRDWGVTTNARITEVTEIYEHGNVRIEPVFGYARPTLIDKIKEIKR